MAHKKAAQVGGRGLLGPTKEAARRFCSCLKDPTTGVDKCFCGGIVGVTTPLLPHCLPLPKF